MQSCYKNVHASGHCSAPYLTRSAAIQAGDRSNHLLTRPDPAGPVVARVKVTPHPTVTVKLPTRYVTDAYQRRLLNTDNIRKIDEPASAASRAEKIAISHDGRDVQPLPIMPASILVELAPRQFSKLLADARIQMEQGNHREIRNSARKTVEELESLGQMAPADHCGR